MTSASQQVLSLDKIVLNATASDMEEAIEIAGNILVQAGHVDPSYVLAMKERETVISTYVGNGVAIPHGTFEVKEGIYSTGISVVQFRQGVDWGDGNIAHLVIGIAAVSDEHMNVLANLARALEDEEEAKKLAFSDDPEEIMAKLSRPAEEDEDD
jgi:PTS system mannitol-specific IIA component